MANLHLLFVWVPVFAGSATADVPPCRKSPEMDSLLGGKELIMYGGKGYKLSKAGLMLGDTWQFDGSTKQWQELSTKSPSARWKTSTTSIANGKAWVLFGGCIGVDASGVQNDLWVFSAVHSAWRQVFTENSPPPRRGHVLVANKTHLIVFGGKSWHKSERLHGTVTVLKDLWALPLSALEDGASLGRWTQGASLPAAARWGATGNVIKKKQRIFSRECLLGCTLESEVLALYGGRVKVNHQYVYFEGLYIYDFLNGTWSVVEPCGHTPGKRDHHAATSFDGDLWVFGGRTSPTRKFKSDVADLWSYSITHNRWTKHKSKGIGPSRRFMPGMSALTYNGHATIAIFGGEHFVKGRDRETTLWRKKWELYNDVWVYDIVEKRWIEISSSNCPGIPHKAQPLAYENEDDEEEEMVEEEIDDDFVEEMSEDSEEGTSTTCEGLSTFKWILILSGGFIVATLGIVAAAIKRGPPAAARTLLNVEDQHGMDYQFMHAS